MKTIFSKANILRYNKVMKALSTSAYMDEIRSRDKMPLQMSEEQRLYLKMNSILFTNSFFEREILD